MTDFIFIIFYYLTSKIDEPFRDLVLWLRGDSTGSEAWVVTADISFLSFLGVLFATILIATRKSKNPIAIGAGIVVTTFSFLVWFTALAKA